MLAWNEFARLVDGSDRILLTTHVRPDGDALGSELGMAELLTQKGKKVVILNPSPTPSRYQFLDPEAARIGDVLKDSTRALTEVDLIVVLDTGAWTQLPGLETAFRGSPARKVVIDHHQTQDDLGALPLVDSTAAACGMLVVDAFRHLDGAMTVEAANALFLAIATDTGWMRHPNATAEVFHVLGELVKQGAQPHVLYRQMYETNSAARLRLLGALLQRIQLSMGGRLASATVSQADVARAEAHPMDTEDFISYPMSIAGVEAAVVLIEQKGGSATKASFRSRGLLDCSKLAEQFAGGGHRNAAGATLNLSLSEALATVLAAAEKALLNVTP